MALEDVVVGVLLLAMTIAGIMFAFAFILHVLSTPSEDKIREIIREELSLFANKGEKDD